MSNHNIIRKIFSSIDDNDIDRAKKYIIECKNINDNPYTDFEARLYGTTNCSPLNYACYKDNFEIAKLLVEFGADIDNNNNSVLSTPLMDALYGTPTTNKPNREIIATLLIESGADMEKENIYGETAVYYIITLVDNNDFVEQESQLKLIKYFEEKGCDIYHKSYIGNILFKSCVCSNIIVAKYLIEERNFDVNMINSDGNNALMYTLTKFFYEQYDVIEFLLNSGVSLDVVNNDGDDAITLAEKTGDEKLINMLLEYKNK